ncbi:MAG: SGNH/GDSL hydrolase family protein [Bacteroidota bacterium]
MTQLLSLTFLFFSFFECMHAQKRADSLQVFTADNHLFQYTGRIDFSNPATPRYWMPGVYVKAKFTGSNCMVVINDEMPNATTHNYIEIAIDSNKPVRLQLKDSHNEIEVANGLSTGEHTIVICKNTEAGTGYIEFVGLKCLALKKLPAKPSHKIECIGNSITCGTGSDQSEIPCGKGVWQDQHNAYMSYGAVTARNLDAQYHLTSVSGIGLMHSCCNLKIIMPQVFDKINMRADSIAWNFKNYIPDVVTICLGQNDGVQDSTAFCSNYIELIKHIRTQYSKASIVCLTSPMADDRLVAVMKKNLTAIVHASNTSGDKHVTAYFFSKRYHNGCDSHPDVAEHQEIANELTGYLRELKGW